MKNFLRIWGVLVFAGGIIFTGLQMYLERRIGVIEMKGHAWELTTPRNSNDLAIKWALTELAPCYDLDGFYYLPKNLHENDYLGLNIDSFVENNTGSWIQCRYSSFSFSRAIIQDFSFLDGLFCPSNKSERQSILEFFYYKRRGLTISNSHFLCVSFSRSRLSQMLADRSFFTGSTFSGSDLSHSEWKGSDLRYVIFDSANLQDAHFNNVKLQGASFEHANLCGAAFEYATLNGAENFDGADVTRADLTGLSMLTERQLLQLCIRPDGPFPALPAHLVGKERLIRRCTGSEIEQIQEGFPQRSCGGFIH